MPHSLLLCLVFALNLSSLSAAASTPPIRLPLWPGTPPGDEGLSLPPEGDQTKPGDRLIAGRRIVKLGNVSTPMIEVHRPPKGKANGTAVIICPGGGHSILAWDLEGTEVATWLNSLGVTAIVLKYRVPSRTRDGDRWKAALQDAQRAISLVRSNAAGWKIDPHRIGILGFSAGGETAGLAALSYGRSHYTEVDEHDRFSRRPDFALLIYSAGFHDPKTNRLRDHVTVPADAPPFFFVHAFNDGVHVQNVLLLAAALKEKNIPTAVHIYPTGGHGYGLRPSEEPVTTWPARAEEWMRHIGFLTAESG